MLTTCFPRPAITSCQLGRERVRLSHTKFQRTQFRNAAAIAGEPCDKNTAAAVNIESMMKPPPPENKTEKANREQAKPKEQRKQQQQTHKTSTRRQTEKRTNTKQRTTNKNNTNNNKANKNRKEDQRSKKTTNKRKTSCGVGGGPREKDATKQRICVCVCEHAHHTNNCTKKDGKYVVR